MWCLGRAGFLMVLAEFVLFGQAGTALAQRPQTADYQSVAGRDHVPPSSLSKDFALVSFDPAGKNGAPGVLWGSQSHDPLIRPHQPGPPYATHALGKRGKIGLIGAALIGAGAALALTAEKTVDVPEMCTRGFFPVVPGGCRPATTKTEINQTQLGAGAGLMIGGMIVALQALWPR